MPAMTYRKVYDVRDFPGVDPTGVTDSKAGIQAAIDQAAADGVPVYGYGTFRINTGITLKGTTLFGDMKLNCHGTTGVTTPASGLVRKTLEIGEVWYAPKAATGWTASTFGLFLRNTLSCQIHIGMIRDFESGLTMKGDTGNGNAYNNIFLGDLWNNKVNLWAFTDATGWSNQNSVYGGRLFGNPAEGTNVAGSVQIKMSGATKPNNWAFYNTSVEGGMHDVAIDTNGGFTKFDNLRFEKPASEAAKVIWRAGAYYNEVRGGHNAQILNVTTESTALYNAVTVNNRLMRFTTAQRNLIGAAAFGPGAALYDDTLDKPIWSTGSQFKDAAGTVV